MTLLAATQNAPYRLSESEEWRVFLRHFELADRFVLLVLTVWDEYGSEECRSALEAHLASRGLAIERLPIQSPADLIGAADWLAGLPVGHRAGAIWISKAAPESGSHYAEWRHAWVQAAARLNEFRNALPRSLHVPLVLAGSPWLTEVLSTVAQDLWSIRTAVTRIAPCSGLPEADGLPSFDTSFDHPDLELSLSDLARVRRLERPPEVLAEALERVSRARIARRELAEGESAAREAITLLSPLVSEGRTDLKALLARALTALASILVWTAAQEALAAATEATELLKAGDKLLFASATGLKASALSRMERPIEAIAAYQESIGAYRELIENGRPDLASELAGRTLNKGVELLKLGHPDAAIDCYSEAIATLRPLVDAGRADAILNLAGAHTNRGNVLASRGRIEEAVHDHSVAIDLSERALDRDRRSRSVLAVAVANRARAFALGSEFASAAADFDRAIEINRDLVSAGFAERTIDIANGLVDKAVLLSHIDRWREAEPLLEEAVAIRRQILDQGTPGAEPRLASALQLLAETRAKLGTSTSAPEAARQARQPWDELSARAPENWLHEREADVLSRAD